MARKKKDTNQTPPLVVQNEPMAFDLGFQIPEQVDVETELGNLAINYEDIAQDLQDQVDNQLSQAQTASSLISTDLQAQVYGPLSVAQANLGAIQNDLEGQLAAQVGNIYQIAGEVSPEFALPTFGGNEMIAVEPSIPGAITTQSVIGPGITVPQPNILPGSPAYAQAQLNQYCQQFINSSPDQQSQWLTPGEIIGWIWVDGQARPVRIEQLPNCQYRAVTSNSGYAIQIPPSLPCGGPCPPEVPPEPPTPPSYPPTQPPSYPPTPPTTPPKPPVPGSSCESPMYMKVCGDEEKKEPPKKYKVFCDADKKIYLQEADQPPKSSGDKLLAEGEIKDLNLLEICQSCQKQEEEQPPGEQQPPTLVPVGSIECPFLAPTPGYGGGVSGTFLSRLFGTRDANGNDRIPELTKDMPALVKPFASAFAQLSQVVTDALGNVLQVFVADGACKSPSYNALVAGQTATGLLSQLLGADFRHTRQLTEYNQNSLCQIGIPSASEASSAWLANTIDQPTLECLVKANNQRLDFWLPYTDAQRAKPSPLEILTAWRRELITLNQCDVKLRELGFIRDVDRELLRKITEQVPGPPDIVSMMVRDVEDDINIDWTESDNWLATNYKGQLKKWGEAQGIPDLMMKYLARAHWIIPSPTQLFEFWHRLRYSGMFGTKDQFYEKIRKALIQQDILPQWIDAYLAVSFRPLTRVDVRRAFKLDLMTSQEVKSSYLDQGYSDDNADKLLRFAENERLRQYDKHPLIKKYVGGEVTLVEIDQEMRADGISSPLVQRVMTKAITAAEREKRKVCVRAYRKRFLMGEFDIAQTVVNVANLGINPLQATQIVSRWECEKSSIGKQVPASTLCHWFDIGLIDATDFYTRLTTLGYAQDTAIKIISDCRDKIGKKLEKDQQVAIAKLRREQEKAARLAKSLVKEFNADQEKATKKAERIREIADRRRRLLIEAADKYSKRTETNLADNLTAIKAIIKSATLNTATTIDFVYQAAVTVADDDNVMSILDFETGLANLLVAAV